ncbi:hypothetical protein C2G38_2055974 [Gigaspora rosea]|uniref:Uncharacterized protein n=1 Tax=Gigaspora rosea TaxID=44941 RepID=A0A397W4T2_9GLOM|nr:hypothetical protein C2G38_2055974 [Gigaspora rosea]
MVLSCTGFDVTLSFRMGLVFLRCGLSGFSGSCLVLLGLVCFDVHYYIYIYMSCLVVHILLHRFLSYWVPNLTLPTFYVRIEVGLSSSSICVANLNIRA